VKGIIMQTRSSLRAEQLRSHQASNSTQLKQNAAHVLDTRDSQFAQRQAQNTASHSSAVSQLMLLQEKMAGKAELTQRVEEEEPLQGKFDAVQRVEEEEALQGKFDAVQRVEEEEPLQGKFGTDSGAIQRKENAQPNNTGLSNQLKSGIESLSGMSMDHVKVHYNSPQPAQMNAHAYAQGSEIHVAPGQEQHVPHEAWHVVQQAQGRVKPTMQLKKGIAINDDVGLETEADVMGAKAMQTGESLHSGAATQLARQESLAPSIGIQNASIQRTVYYAAHVTQFTNLEATAWNALVAQVAGLPTAEAFVEQVEADIYVTPQVVTLTNSMAGLRAAARVDINARVRDPADANALTWGEFHPMLVDMATTYGTVTGPVNTGGHSANTYTYTAGGGSQGIAEETSAHGRTPGNLTTRRAQMRAAIGLFNLAVAADAARF
jgi:hypothetical protein